jgi:hypothetical protein
VVNLERFFSGLGVALQLSKILSKSVQSPARRRRGVPQRRTSRKPKIMSDLGQQRRFRPWAVTSGLSSTSEMAGTVRKVAKGHNRKSAYSITSSARAKRIGETVSPIALAVLRFITNSILVGCSTGISPALTPRSILSTRSAARRYMSGILGP